jgi:IS5 family transposase
MRKSHEPQRSFESQLANWEADPELAQMDRLLDQCLHLCERVAADLAASASRSRGSEGLRGDQALRSAVAKQLKGLSYRQLANRIDDSYRLRAFCRFDNEQVPEHNTFQDNLSAITAETWEAVNQALIGYAVDHQIEDGQRARFDSTAVETAIHHPSDSRLIEDCVRVALRLMGRAKHLFGDELSSFHDRSRAVKRRVFKIANTKSSKRQTTLYRELLGLAAEVESDATQVTADLQSVSLNDESQVKKRDAFHADLGRLLEQFAQVLDQCRRRVLHGEKVPASEKLLSIFEPHTDIIAKGGRETVFGHKIWLSGGASNLIFDCIIERGNGSDSTMFASSLERTRDILGTVPNQVATDDGFASEANAAYAKAQGVEEIVFGGKLKNELTKWVSSKQTQKKLRNFRAGIEAIVSATKRAFGLDRCRWSGWPCFQRYVWLSVVAWNLQTLARHLLA